MRSTQTRINGFLLRKSAPVRKPNLMPEYGAMLNKYRCASSVDGGRYMRLPVAIFQHTMRLYARPLGRHRLRSSGLIAASLYCIQVADNVDFPTLFALYSVSVAFFMPTIALANSVSYNALDKAGLDAVKAFPPIRVFGTVGFIVSMWIVDLSGWQTTSLQFLWRFPHG